MSRRLSDVAEKVGVSEATVSRVLNGKPGVSQATREAVLTALDVLGYERPTKLRGDRARLVGLILPELTNPIFPALAEVIGGALVQQRFTPVMCTRTAGGITESEYIDLLLEQGAAGVIFAGGLYTQAEADHSHYRRLRERRVPVVLVNAAVPSLGFPQVSCDDVVAVQQSLRHLVSLGHSRIGLLLGPRDHVPSQRKLTAARAFATDHGLDLDDTMVAWSQYSLESGQAGSAHLLSAGVSAVVAASDLLALGAVRAARRAGRRVPEDFSVVGYDDSPLMTCTDPSLTTVRQPIEPMGRAAVDLLADMVSGTSVPYDELLFEPELVVRGSTTTTAAAAPPR